MNIEFKNPPVGMSSGRNLSAETQEIIDALKANQGQWALIRKATYPNVATQWRKRAGFEAKATTIGAPQGKCDVYARYIGEAA